MVLKYFHNCALMLTGIYQRNQPARRKSPGMGKRNVMAPKKEASKLIEVLLQQQRLQRPKEQNPLAGIAWQGLPPELQKRVYKPHNSAESLDDLLLSINQAQRNPEMDPDPDAPDLKPAAPKPEIAPEPPMSLELAHDGVSISETGPLPQSPGLLDKLKIQLASIFGFLNRRFEVRMATVVGAGVFLLVISLLSFLVGKHLANPYEVALTQLSGPVENLMPAEPVAPKSPRPQSPIRQPAPATGNHSGQNAAPVTPSTSPAFTLRVAASARKGVKDPLKAAAEYLREHHGYEAYLFLVGDTGEYIVTVGNFQSMPTAQEKAAIKKALSRLKIPNVAGRMTLPTWEPRKSKQVYP